MKIYLVTALLSLLNVVSCDMTHTGADMYEPNPLVGETVSFTSPKATS